jgi:hypothetical protein
MKKVRDIAHHKRQRIIALLLFGKWSLCSLIVSLVSHCRPNMSTCEGRGEIEFTSSFILRKTSIDAIWNPKEKMNISAPAM